MLIPCPSHATTQGTSTALRSGFLGILDKAKTCSFNNIYNILEESETGLLHQFDSCREITLHISQF